MGLFAQHLVRNAPSTWHMRVSDDFRIEASGAGYREAPITFFLVRSPRRAEWFIK